jgi:hypothetical protein
MLGGSIGILYFFVTISCVAPIAYQTFTLLWPRLPGYLSFLFALVLLIGAVFTLFLLIPTFEEDGGPSILTLNIAAILLYVLGIAATLRTAWELYRMKLDDGFRVIRSLASVVLIGYSIVLMLGLYLWFAFTTFQ